MDYKEIIKKRLDLLSPELRDFILNENWRKDAEKIGQEFNFNEEKYALFENEIFFVLLCFEPKKDFQENIKNGLGISDDIAKLMSEEVTMNIFSKVSNELDAIEKQMEENEIAEEQKPTNKVGESFEQIILNQTKAMQPAVASPKLGYGMAKPAIDEQRWEAPENLPVNNSESRAIHNYIGESDPYREPVE